MVDIVSGKYPGRALFFGIMKRTGIRAALYTVGGRSPGSKSRYLNGFSSPTFRFIRTLPLEGEEDFIHNYNAMAHNKESDYIVVSNGIHTDNIISMMETQISKKPQVKIPKLIKNSLGYGLAAWGAEPDKPNYTARIGGVAWKNHVALGLIVHEAKEPRIYSFNIEDTLNPGDFVGVSTYDKDTPHADIPDYLTSGIGGDLWGINLKSDSLSDLTKEFYELMEKNKIKYTDNREETTLVAVCGMTFRGDFTISNVVDQE